MTGAAVLDMGTIVSALQFAHGVVSSDRAWTAVYAAIQEDLAEEDDPEELGESGELRADTHDAVDKAMGTVAALLMLLPAVLGAGSRRELPAADADMTGTGMYL